MTQNREYWKNRFEAIESSTNKDARELLIDIDREFSKAERVIDEKIEHWYSRIAKNNDISLHDAKKLLDARELKEFHWTVDEYITVGQKVGLDPSYMKQLENASARVHISRLDALKLDLQQANEVLYGNLTDPIDELMRNTYEESYYKTAYEVQKGFRTGWQMPQLDTKTVENILNKPWTADKLTFSDRIWGYKVSLLDELQTGLVQNLMLGKPPDDLIKTISKKMGTSKSNAGRLVMTESAYFSAEAQGRCFKELDVEQYEIVATLDSITSPICQDLDGKVFPMSQYQAGITAPPFHPWCRTVTVPYFADNFTERAARGADGKTYHVPSDMKYNDWKKTQENLLNSSSSNGIIKVNSKMIKNNKNYSKKEAVDRLDYEYGIQFTDSKKYPIDEKLLSQQVNWIDNFVAEYPGFRENNPCMLSSISNVPPNKMKRAIGKYSFYRNSAEVDGITLNGGYFANTDFFNKYLETAIDAKWTVQNATANQTFVHEYGHHVSNSMRWITDNPNWEKEFLKDCIAEFNLQENLNIKSFADMGDYVSHYGATQYPELFAETFSEYYGGENPREFATIFGEKLDKILKGVK